MSKQKKGSSTSWFKLLQMELQMADPSEAFIREDVKPNDDVLGTASDEAQRLYAYASKLEEHSTRLLVDATYEQNEEKREEMYRQGAEMRAKMAFLDHLLIMQLREEFGIWKPDVSLGLRKGFQVVQISGKNPLTDLLKGLGY